MKKKKKKNVLRQLNDIRDEMDKVNAVEFTPADYYKEGHFFFGLDEDHQPVYLDDKQFASRHCKILGPSQTGKGVGSRN